MQYFQCRCGDMKTWTSMGPSPCMLCKKCGTTFGGSPTDHKTVAEPHDWYEEDTVQTYRGVVTKKHTRKCLHCGQVEKL